MGRTVNFREISVHAGPERSPGFLLWHVSTAWRGAIEDVLKPLGLTHPQFVLLATLGWLTRYGERVTQAAVGKMAGVDPNTTSQIVKGLEKKGLLSREQGEDTRAKNPRLTEEGARLLSQALPAVEGADAEFFKPLTVGEGSQMLEIFRKLLNH